jgi:hypothetical protein
MLDLASTNMYLAAQRLEVNYCSQEARSALVQAAKDVLQSTMKVGQGEGVHVIDSPTIYTMTQLQEDRSGGGVRVMEQPRIYTMKVGQGEGGRVIEQPRIYTMKIGQGEGVRVIEQPRTCYRAP